MTPDPVRQNGAGSDPEDPSNEAGPDEDPGTGGVPDGGAGETSRGPPAPQTGRPQSLAVPEEIDWRGWLLVAVVLLAVLVLPAIVLFIPQMSGLLGALGFTRRQAYLVFPMVPAILLGIVAVWAAVSAAGRDD